ncbi:MAG: type II toxin-antitoxin system PemK/MazF family toxin [Gemmataceae bacterium]|nr:type II toxin-antitoxin system PemK/MazF family toxin [Gemmataceae bacterium]
MPKPQRGRIIIAELLDPQGRNRKPRPLVIVSPNEEIEASVPFWCVAVTGALPKKPPEGCVLLRYHPKGHPRTGLRKRCAAIPSWLVQVCEEDIVRYLGSVSTSEMNQILSGIEDLESTEEGKQGSET